MTESDILKALSNVQEPDLGKDLVTLNMIQDIVIDGNHVAFTIVLTTPACPMKDMMRTASENAIKILVNKEAIIQVNFTANTTSKRLAGDKILSGVKHRWPRVQLSVKTETPLLSIKQNDPLEKRERSGLKLQHSMLRLRGIKAPDPSIRNSRQVKKVT